MPYWLEFFVSWATVIWIVYRIFNAAGEAVNNKYKKATTEWLKNTQKGVDSSWPSQILVLFDRVFSKKRLSLKCFIISSLFSTLSFIAVFLLLSGPSNYFTLASPPWETDPEVVKTNQEIDSLTSSLDLLYTATRPVNNESQLNIYEARIRKDEARLDAIMKYELKDVGQGSLDDTLRAIRGNQRLQLRGKKTDLKELRDRIYNEERHQFYTDTNSNISFYQLLVIFFFANLIPDYLSLIQTRYMLTLMEDVDILFGKIFLLLLDFCFTFFIFWVSIFTFLQIGLNISEIKMDLNDVANGPGYFVSRNSYLIIFLFTSYFTSIWICLYLVSSLVLKIFKPWKFVVIKGVEVFDVENKPFKTIGFFSIFLISLLYLFWGISNLI